MKKVLSVILSIAIIFCATKKSARFEASATNENIIKSICKEFLENAQKMGQICEGIREIQCGMSFFVSTWYAAKSFFKEKNKSVGLTQAYHKLEEGIEKSEQLDGKLRGISYVLSFFASVSLMIKSLYNNLSAKFYESSKTEKDNEAASTEESIAKPKNNGAIIDPKIEISC